MSPARKPVFDPRAILASLERAGASYIVIGGLARVLRGSDELTTGVDICPSPTADNLERLARGLVELGAAPTDGFDLGVTEQTLTEQPVLELATPFGELKIILAPAGAPRGFVALRGAASKENLGHGLQPYVASVGDLAAMAAGLHRSQDVARLPELRRIMKLEVDREQTIARPARRETAARSSATHAPRGASPAR
jgi:hypothetical protein